MDSDDADPSPPRRRNSEEDWEPAERLALQRVAAETGERFGAMDAIISQHSVHFREINGAISELARNMAEEAKQTAVLATTLKTMERTIDHKVLSHESRLTVIEAWVAENRGSSATTLRSKGTSLQWTLAIFAAVVAILLAIFGAIMTLVVLLAENVL